jgi:hypothetical protein
MYDKLVHTKMNHIVENATCTVRVGYGRLQRIVCHSLFLFDNLVRHTPRTVYSTAATKISTMRPVAAVFLFY